MITVKGKIKIVEEAKVLIRTHFQALSEAQTIGFLQKGFFEVMDKRIAPFVLFIQIAKHIQVIAFQLLYFIEVKRGWQSAAIEFNSLNCL